jgi:DNA replication protein DnaC
LSATSLSEALSQGTPSPVRAAASTIDLGRIQRNCDRHGAYMAAGRHYVKLRRDIWSGCPTCTDVAHRAAVQANRQREMQEREQRRQGMVAEAIEHAAIPERFKTRSLDNFEPRTEQQKVVLELARRFVAGWEQTARAGRWLVFAGEPGVGKSHIAIAILRALMPTHVGQYITCMGMIQAVRATWGRNATTDESQVLRHFGTTPLLVVDEIGVQYGTDGEHTIIFDVLDRRYRDMRPTILLTNQDVEGFKGFIGERLYDRMKENTRWVQFDGASFRKEAREATYADGAGGSAVGDKAQPGADSWD